MFLHTSNLSRSFVSSGPSLLRLPFRDCILGIQAQLSFVAARVVRREKRLSIRFGFPDGFRAP
jgi:hypothetical protein